MSFLAIADMNTHLREYNIATISGGDETILTQAISGAISEVKGYLGNYDRDTIFGKEGANRDALLLKITKDVAVWHFITLMNAGTELENRKDIYYIARDWLKAVQKGNITPDLPKLTDDESNEIQAISYGSGEARNNKF